MEKRIKTLLQNKSYMRSQKQEFKLLQFLGVGPTSSVLRHLQVTSVLHAAVSTVSKRNRCDYGVS